VSVGDPVDASLMNSVQAVETLIQILLSVAAAHSKSISWFAVSFGIVDDTFFSSSPVAETLFDSGDPSPVL
jgi:hypothetical protein